jgi:serine/threonine protein kinase
VEKEITLAARMHHPNVVAVFGVCIVSTNEVWLIMEYGEEGSLHCLLADETKVKMLTAQQNNVLSILEGYFMEYAMEVGNRSSLSSVVFAPTRCDPP